MSTEQTTRKIAAGNGFIAALDQSGGSTPQALRGYGVADDEWNGEDEMFAQIHKMRSRIMASHSFTSDKILGAILFEKTMDGQVDGKPTPQALLEKGIAPIIKIDKGLADETNGVQMMKPMPDLEALLARAKSLGVYGTKERSAIHKPDPKGIADIVVQQFEVGLKVLEHGMMPILEPEYSINAEGRAEGEEILKTELLGNIDRIPAGQQVMIKLSLPVKPNLYKALVDHPKVLKVVALSGGFSRDEACKQLAKNDGMIASFSRAMLADLRVSMSDAEFDASLGEAIDAIYTASTVKTT